MEVWNGLAVGPVRLSTYVTYVSVRLSTYVYDLSLRMALGASNSALWMQLVRRYLVVFVAGISGGCYLGIVMGQVMSASIRGVKFELGAEHAWGVVVLALFVAAGITASTTPLFRLNPASILRRE